MMLQFWIKTELYFNVFRTYSKPILFAFCNVKLSLKNQFSDIVGELCVDMVSN